MTLRGRLVLLAMALIGAIAAFVYLFFPARMQARILNSVAIEAREVARMTAFAVSPALVFGDREAGQESLKGAAQVSDIAYVVVTDASGRTFASIHPERAAASDANSEVAPGPAVYRVTQPILDGARQIGTLRLALSLAPMRAEVSQMRRTIALVSLLIFVIGVAAALTTGRFLTRPLAQMVSTAERIARGDRESRAPGGGRDEIGKLAASFNTMLDRLGEARGELEDLNQTLEHRVAERTAELEGEIQERRRGEAALQRANERFALAAAAVNGAVYDWDIEHGTIVWTDGLTRVFGYPQQDVAPTLEWRSGRIHPDDSVRVLRQLKEDVEAGRDFVADYRFLGHTQRSFDVLDRGRVLRDESGRVVRMVGVMEDVTELKRLEDQLRQAQKMEAVGRLAGGVAHDFNNLLTTILGYSHLLIGQTEASQPEREEVEEIQRAAERAASLTRQLLAFSRRQVTELKVLDLNTVVANMEKMLVRLIGEDVRLETILEPGLQPVKADRGQIEQVVMNIAVNARDAMTRGGRLVIRTANVTLDETFGRQHKGARPGVYTMLSFADDGTGMDAATKEHVFEPFFTTKPSGKGTGLGLATVYGIVKQAGGYVRIDSEPGRGTTVTVYLPQVREEISAPAAAAAHPRGGTETVLVVEDESGVRTLVRSILRSQGYRVIEAADGSEALERLAEGTPIDLLLTDVVMPGISGRELADRARAERPGIRLLYMSGYTEDTIVLHGVRSSATAFLQKPFTPDALLAKVREALDAGGGSGRARGAPPSTPA